MIKEYNFVVKVFVRNCVIMSDVIKPITEALIEMHDEL